MKNKFLLLTLFCMFSSVAMEEEAESLVAPAPPTLAEIFDLPENRDEVRSRLLYDLFFTILESGPSKLTDKFITKIGLFIHPDKVHTDIQEIANELFKLFQDLTLKSLENCKPGVENQPWLMKVPKEAGDMFVHRFFELLETSRTYPDFKEKLNIIITLAHTKGTDNNFLLNTYATESINNILENGLNILKKNDFDTLKGILLAKYPDFESILTNTIEEAEAEKYAYLFDILREFQTFDRFDSTIKPNQKVAYWFDTFNKYKREIVTNRMEDGYQFDKVKIDQQKVAAAIILDVCGIDPNQALQSDEEQFNTLSQAIINWADRSKEYRKKGYKDFKSYKNNYDHACNALKSALEFERQNILNATTTEEENTRATKRIDEFLANGISDFVNKILILEKKSQFNRNTNTLNAGCLFCLKNGISPKSLLPHNKPDEQLWNKNIASFGDFIEQYKKHQIMYPSLFRVEEENKDATITSTILRFIELTKRNSTNSKVFDKFLNNPVFSKHKIEVIDNYFFFSPRSRLFRNYVEFITSATNKYRPFVRNDDNNTLLVSFVTTEDRIMQTIPKHSQQSFKDFLDNMISKLQHEIIVELQESDIPPSETALNEKQEKALKNKGLFLKAFLDCYTIPFEIEDHVKRLSCLPQQLSFDCLQKAINVMKEKFIQNNWFELNQNPDFANIATDLIKSSAKAALLGINPQPIVKTNDPIIANKPKSSIYLSDLTGENEAKSKKFQMHHTYFKHYVDFVSLYYLIIPKQNILKSFDEWLDAIKQKKNSSTISLSIPTLGARSDETQITQKSFLRPIVSLLQGNNPQFTIDNINEADPSHKIQEEATKQLHSSWKWQIQQTVHFAIESGLLQIFLQEIGSKVAKIFPGLKQMSLDERYQNAYEHYEIGAIKDLDQRKHATRQLKKEYNKLSNIDHLLDAINKAAPLLSLKDIADISDYF